MISTSRRLVVPSLCLALGVLWPCSAGAAERSGEEIFRTGCATCHGTSGRGVDPASVAFPEPVPDLTDCNFAHREPDADWFAVIHDGGPARGFARMMPAFGDELSKREMDAVLRHVRTLCTEKAWPRGDLNFPRALVTEKAFVEDELVVTSAVGLRDQTQVQNKLIYEQRFLARSQFEVIVPFSVIESDDGDTRAGLGDVAVGAKSVVVHSLNTGTIFSLAGEIILPTGNQDRGFGKGIIVLEPFLALGQVLPWNGFLHLQAGAEIPTEEKDGVENELFCRLAVGTSFEQAHFGRAWSPIVEAIGFRELESGAKTHVDVVPQLQISLNQRQHILGSVGVRIPLDDRATRKPDLMFYLLWDWFDGGLREGW